MGTGEEAPVAEKEDEAVNTASENDGGFSDYLRIFRYADRWDWILNAISLCCSIAAGTTMPLMTVVFGRFTKTFNEFSQGQLSTSQYQKETHKYMLLFIYLFVAKLVLIYAATTCITISGMRTTRAIRRAFLDHLLRLEIWHFDTASNGAAATQVTTNGNRINQGIAEKLGLVVQCSAMFFSAFIIALAVQWKLALITMTIIPAIFIVVGITVAIDATLESRVVRIYSQGSVLVQEAISSIKTIHAFWAQEKMAEKYETFLQKAHIEGSKKSANYGIMFSVEYFCVYAGTALAFWQGHRMFQSGEIDNVGTVFTVEMAVLMAATSMSLLAPQFTALSGAAAAAAELFRVMDKPSKLDPLDPSGHKPSTCEGNITVRDIDFAYPSRPSAQVLQGFSIDIPAGKTTALVGASGSGKSTLIGLLERWYEPSHGSITLDGINLSEYNVKWLRSNIRLVQQEPVLFKGSVFENVAKGLVESQLSLTYDQKMELVQKACTSSNADDFIQQLPQGYHTQVGERASRLSGGQKQRIAIARSIISNPKILLLDEATSALDPKAERIVQDALDRVSKDRTTIVIAHRLSTIMNADNIAVMSEGKIVEMGTHEALIKLDGRYSALVHAQDLGGGNQGGVSEHHENPDSGEDDEKGLEVVRTKTRQDLENGIGLAQPEEGETLGYSLIRCLFIMFSEQRQLYPALFISVLACLVGGGTFPAQAILFSRVLNVFTLEGSEATKEANFWALMFFIVAIANLIAYFILGWLCNIIGQDITHRYRYEMFTMLLSLDMDFFDRPHNTSGALTSKLSAMPTQLMELMSMNVFLILIIVVNIVSSSILALAYGWKLSLVVLFGGLVPLVLAGYIRIRLETALDTENGDRFAESAGLASEAVLSIRTVSSLTLEADVLNEFSEMLNKIVSLDFLVMALGFWYGSRLLISGEYTATQFYVIFIGILFAGQAAAQFFGWTSSLTKAVGAANYILWLRTLEPVINENNANKDIGPDGDEDINFEHVDFKYPQAGNSRVLRNISMTITSGQFVAFVGASGCGKSTLISLMERYYDPTSGHILLGKRDISTLSPRLYRSHLSLVQQEPTLYEGSVFDNVTLGLPTTPSTDTVLDACRQANALDFVLSLPEGLGTSCGARGTQFSGGQRQRIAIARALIRDPRILLLDEATSALDTQSERLVQDALKDAAKAGGRITVAVAHRLSTIRDADFIFVYSGGEIIEAGTHDALQQKGGVYYQMCLAQSLDR
ncbi:hypothetical protein V493_03749 [Pseudogymnoascus sp. VKM F-4281 (FW-2241)]|nr:hypothetical protein V493_03749 [Pseudogymnoascus sp. VKM F-4281 (FW-2241)]